MATFAIKIFFMITGTGKGNIKEITQHLLNDFGAKAVIFDLDGTLIDNNRYHLESWIKYLESTGRQMSEEEYNKKINGRTNRDVIKYIYNRPMEDEEIEKFTQEKEAVYRETYKNHIQPVAGLLPFLQALHELNIPMAIATSGIEPNIDFMFENIPIKKYFQAVVNSAHISRGKPDPEIYIKTASLLNIPPNECLVFEDAVVGINAAKAAGMKVVAIATTHVKEELTGADMIIDDYFFKNSRNNQSNNQ